jgi:hypothetical protein
VAYPFGPMPTLGEYVQKAREQGCTLGTTTAHIVGRPDQEVRYLSRSGPPHLVAVLPAISDEDRLTPSVVRSLSNQLAIPLSAFFGFDLE